tara:strand:- start:34528 stop:35007 length:480 start_codon:yes stop_codon:yes gene_type:complete
MISYHKWKEDIDMSRIMQMLNSPEQPEMPQLSDFKGFINDRVNARGGKSQAVKEFIGDLAAHPKARDRIQLLDAHGDIRDDVMHMRPNDWAEMEKSFEDLHPKEHQRMGHALRWLHMHMKSMGSSYNRKNNNLGQWKARFTKSRTPKDLGSPALVHQKA